MEKMTQIDKYLFIADHMREFPEIVEFCDSRIAQLQARSAKVREKRAANDVLTEVVYNALDTEEFTPIADIVAAIDDPDLTVAKVTYRLSQLSKAGRVLKEKIAVPTGEDGKTRKVMGYRAIK